jgi:hypothetical protein
MNGFCRFVGKNENFGPKKKELLCVDVRLVLILIKWVV